MHNENDDHLRCTLLKTKLSHFKNEENYQQGKYKIKNYLGLGRYGNGVEEEWDNYLRFVTYESDSIIVNLRLYLAKRKRKKRGSIWYDGSFKLFGWINDNKKKS